MADKLERIYTIPLSKAYMYTRTRRAERAIKLLRAFATRHMKVDEEGVRISEGVNSLVWRDSIQKPPRKIKVRVVREDGNAKIWLLGEEEEIKKAEEARKKAEDEKKKEEEKKKAQSAPKPEEKKEVPSGAKEAAAKGDAKKEEPKAPAQAAPRASDGAAAKKAEAKRDAVKARME